MRFKHEKRYKEPFLPIIVFLVTRLKKFIVSIETKSKKFAFDLLFNIK